MDRITVKINPQILKWSREEAGYSIEEIIPKLNIDSTLYLGWERDGNNIPFGKLKLLSQYYKRQTATFFLPTVPIKNNKPKDFRNLSIDKSTLSKKVLLTMRRAVKLRNSAIDLEGIDYWKSKYDWINIENTTDWLREKLKISLESQMKFSSPNDALKQWRNAIEKELGILVFQFSMPLEEVQGFCYTDTFPYVIVINSKHSYTGRIFTLFHELSHIFRNEAGICIPDSVNESQTEEFVCNQFAGNFLVPSNVIIKTSSLNEIDKYSKRLKISKEVYLRRLYDLGLINQTTFFDLLMDIKEGYKLLDKKDGFVKPIVKSKAERGETYFNLILDSLSQNKVSYSYAADSLGLTLKTLLNEI